MKKVLLAMAAMTMMLVGCSKESDSLQVKYYEYNVADSEWTPWIDVCYYKKNRDAADHAGCD